VTKEVFERGGLQRGGERKMELGHLWVGGSADTEEKEKKEGNGFLLHF
jgi:hypothetical protein